MDPFSARKRVRPDVGLNANGGITGSKRAKPESDSISSGLGSKSKPCTKFFSTAGCPFGEGCHFLHYVPGGYSAISQVINQSNTGIPSSRNIGLPLSDLSTQVVKSRMCNKFNTAEGCKFGERCHFAHSERELGRSLLPGHDDRILQPTGGSRLTPTAGPGRIEPPPPGLGAAASFGASATAKISVDASLAGAIIGKGGVNSKHICRVTGAKLAIRDHESDTNLRNIELEGTFDQIKQASAMVRELIVNVGSAPGSAVVATKPAAGIPIPASNYKTKICENFTKGSCTFAERCHFAHGAAELRKSAV